jgi:hypothetical protein
MNKWLRLPLHLGTLLIVTACSAFAPENTSPYCGASISYQSVQIVDLTSFRNPGEQLDSVLRDQFENYRLVTDKPVQVPRDYVYWNRKNIKGISGARSEASEWGCNLLVLMEKKAARTSVGVQSRNEDVAWMVHVGTVNP